MEFHANTPSRQNILKQKLEVKTIKGIYNDTKINKRKGYIPINTYTQYRNSYIYINQILTNIKGEIYNNTVTVWDFNTPLTSKDISSRQTINKATVIMNNKYIT